MLIFGYLTFNVFNMLKMITFGYVDAAIDDKNMTFWSWTASIILLICFVLAHSLFNCATWFMGFNYYYCAASLKFVRMHQQQPKDVKKM